MIPRLLLTVILAAGFAASQSHRSEFFDTSGMPRRPTNFVEQQILDLIASHPKGDLASAGRIQRKLGSYYADQGDEDRATAAFLRASAAEESPLPKAGPTAVVATVPPERQAERPEPTEPRKSSRQIDGSYFGHEGRLLHTWEFYKDGTFLHTWIASGAGTSVRNSERGTYSLIGNVLELHVRSSAGGFVTPGLGGRSTLSSGGTEARTEVRRLSVRFLKPDNAIVLDGIKLNPKSW